MVLRAFKVIILRGEGKREIYFCQKRKAHFCSIHTAFDVGKQATEEVSANLMLFNLKASLSKSDTSSEVFFFVILLGDCKDCL